MTTMKTSVFLSHSSKVFQKRSHGKLLTLMSSVTGWSRWWIKAIRHLRSAEGWVLLEVFIVMRWQDIWLTLILPMAFSRPKRIKSCLSSWKRMILTNFLMGKSGAMIMIACWHVLLLWRSMKRGCVYRNFWISTKNLWIWSLVRWKWRVKEISNVSFPLAQN